MDMEDIFQQIDVAIDDGEFDANELTFLYSFVRKIMEMFPLNYKQAIAVSIEYSESRNMELYVYGFSVSS